MSPKNKTKQELIDEINELKKQLRAAKRVSTPERSVRDIEPEKYKNLPFGYCLFDKNKVYYINDEAIKMLRIPKNQLKNIEELNIYMFIHKDYHKEVRSRNEQIMKGKIFNGVEIKCIDTKGKVFDVESHSRPVYYKGKKVLQAFFKNISDKKIIQEELLRSRSNYENIISKIDEVVFYYNREERKIEYISNQLYDLIGVKAADYIKNPRLSVELAHPDDLPMLYKVNELLNKTGKPQHLSYRVFHKKKKQYIWIEEKIFPQYDKKGKHIANLGISRDVTLQIDQEEQLKLSEEKFRLLAENASDIIFSYLFKPQPHYSYISPSMEKITGYALKNFYDDPYFGFKITHPEDKKRISVKETLKTLKDKTNKFEEINTAQVVRFIKKDGKTIWLETRYTPIKQGDEIIGQEGISRDITAQKEAEIELAEKERTIRNLFNNLPGMAYRCLNDKHWTMQFLSDGCFELTGYKPADLISNKNRSYSDIVHPEDILTGKDDIYFAIKNKTTFEIEYRIVSKHGKIIWVWEKGEGIYDDSGKLLYIEGFITDISERKVFESELNQKWINYKNLIEKMPVGIFIHDRGKIIFGNEYAQKFTDIESHEQMLKTSVFDFLDDEFKKIAIERTKLVTQGLEAPPIKYPITSLKGKEYVVSLVSVPIIFDGKNVSQLIFQDITKETLLEKETARAQQAESINQQLHEEIENRIITERELNKTKNYLQSIIESSIDMITASDKNGRIIEFNKAALDAFGYELEEVLGRTADFMFSSKTNQVKAIAELMKTGYFKGEVINKRKSGEEFVSYLSASVLKNEKGEVIGTMGVSRDITIEKERERLLKERQEQIIKQSSRINSIFESTSHLIWTIDKEFVLTSFNSNFSEVLTKKYKNTPKLGDKLPDYLKGTGEDEYKNFWKPMYDRALKGENVIMEKHDVLPDGKDLFWIIYINPIYNHQKDVVEISCLANDITEIKTYEKRAIEQSAKLKAIFDNGNQLFWTVNENRELVTFNQKYAEAIYMIYGFYPKLGGQLRASAEDRIKDNYYDFWGKKYREVWETEQTINFVTERDTPNGKKIYRQIFLYPIFDGNKKIIEIGGIGIDISDLKYYEEKTVEQAAKLNAIIDNAHHRIWSINRNFELTSINRNYEMFIESVFGVTPKVGDAMDKPPFVSTDSNNEFFRDNVQKAFSGETVDFIYSVKNKKGETIWFETFLAPIRDKDGKINEISAIANDITMRKQIEDEKNRQTALIKAIFDSSSQLIYTINKNLELTSFNKNYYDYVKSSNGQETFVGKSMKENGLNERDPETYDQWMRFHNEALSGKHGYYKSTAVKANGELVHMETFIDPVYLPGGDIEEVSYITLDITPKFLAEEQLKGSLREKDILLKEVHHRVKNNLQVISSILNLQSTYVRDEKTLYILRECQNRIKSMAFIHEALYQNKNFSEIQFNEYLIMLVRNLFQTYNIDHTNVKLNFDIDEVFLNLDMSIPCGLIVNELVSNSFKYAFPDKKQGFIFISLKSENDDVTLIIKDNGVGLPNEIDFKNTESLGLQLVVTLVEQIGGNIRLDKTNGTKFEITFKQPEKNV